MGEKVVHDRTLVALGKGGEGVTLPLLQLVEGGLGARRTSHRCPRGFDVLRPLSRLPHPRRSQWSETMFRPPQTVRREDCYRDVSLCRRKFAPSLLTRESLNSDRPPGVHSQQ